MLIGKVAIVTGGSGSIGGAIAYGLAREGASVVVVFHDGKDRAAAHVDRIVREGGRALSSQADVTCRGDVQRVVAACVSEFGRLDILVNGAGVLKRTPFLDISDGEWDWVLRTNLSSYFICSQEAARAMVGTGGGTIINVSSASQEVAGKDLTHYCVSKGGIRSLTMQLALELAPYGIRANAVAPGLIETALNKRDLEVEAFRHYRLGMIPLGIIGVPEDVVGAVVFLASDGSRLATGSTIFLDGGQSIT